jgi:hypothetical protein
MASQHPFPASVDGGKLLNEKEHKACLKLCVADDEITRNRAKALMALDEGCTQSKAGTLSGLTRGQVNYLVVLFRKKGMDLFPRDTDANTEKKKKPADSGKNKLAKKVKKKKSTKKEKKKTKGSAKKDNSKNVKKLKKKGKKKKGKKK